MKRVRYLPLLVRIQDVAPHKIPLRSFASSNIMVSGRGFRGENDTDAKKHKKQIYKKILLALYRLLRRRGQDRGQSRALMPMAPLSSMARESMFEKFCHTLHHN